MKKKISKELQLKNQIEQHQLTIDRALSAIGIEHIINWMMNYFDCDISQLEYDLDWKAPPISTENRTKYRKVIKNNKNCIQQLEKMKQVLKDSSKLSRY